MVGAVHMKCGNCPNWKQHVMGPDGSDYDTGNTEVKLCELAMKTDLKISLRAEHSVCDRYWRSEWNKVFGA